MMTYKYILFSIFIVFGLSVHTNAQKKTALGKSDPEAKKILDQTAKVYKSYADFKADFSLKVNNAKSKTINTQKGTIWLKKDQFKFKTNTLTVFSDGESLWTYNKENNEVQITDYDPENGEITPSSIFNDFYDKNLLYRLDKSMTLNGVKTKVIEMTPLDKSKSYFKILTWINLDNHHIVQMKVFDKSGYRYIYTIHSFQPNVHLTASDFTFSKKDFPGASVQDLRL